jgi:lipoic acid synthetase
MSSLTTIETVERLHPIVRDIRAKYGQSLAVLEEARRSCAVTKSSIMLGHGESEAELLKTMRDLRSVGVSILTLGQYLQPSQKQLPVTEFVQPERFDAMRIAGEEMGFAFVASGPLVRSSYKAAEVFAHSHLEKANSSLEV